MEDHPSFDRADYPLLGLRLESWTGLLFVSFDDEAAPLARQLESFPDLSRFRLGELSLVERRSYDVEANWKAVGENYGECYHCPLAHPHLNRVSDYRNAGRSFQGPFFNGGPMALNPDCNTMTLSGRTDRPTLTEVEDDRRSAHYFHLYPSLLLSVLPDFVLVHSLWPVDPGRTRVVCDWLFPAETVERDDFDPSDAVEFWDLTNRQDWELCARVQLGVRSRGHRPGPFNELEVCVRTFGRWYLDYMESSPGLGRNPSSTV
jgi:Rieske 2Fe-2S family protein